jgi:hypothetical protein
MWFVGPCWSLLVLVGPAFVAGLVCVSVGLRIGKSTGSECQLSLAVREKSQKPDVHSRSFESIYLPWVDLPADKLLGDLLFSVDSSSSADDGGETSPWRTIAFASMGFP